MMLQDGGSMYDRDTLTKWDKKYIWHPFTQMEEYADTTPLIIEEGDGSYLIDVEGNRYIDGISSLLGPCPRPW